MSYTNHKKKYGIVILLDALGAATYSENQIKDFLSSRADINGLVSSLSSQFPKNKGKFYPPVIFTFGDTVIITIELRTKKHIFTHLFFISILMRRYLFHSMEQGILFRGSFSIGSYIEDFDSNTVMGEAVTDAAAWYEKSNWMGLSSTPKTKNVLEYYLLKLKLEEDSFSYLHRYDVPMKNGVTHNLYVVSWPSAFFDEHLLEKAEIDDGKHYFYKILKDLPIPLGTEMKYENTKQYFEFVSNKILMDDKTL